jgi:hypothetical protein
MIIRIADVGQQVTLHQGAIENIFLDSMKAMGVEVSRPVVPTHLDLDTAKLGDPNEYAVRVSRPAHQTVLLDFRRTDTRTGRAEASRATGKWDLHRGRAGKVCRWDRRYVHPHIKSPVALKKQYRCPLVGPEESQYRHGGLADRLCLGSRFVECLTSNAPTAKSHASRYGPANGLSGYPAQDRDTL